MQDTAMVPRKRDGDPPPRPPLVDEQLADELLGKAQAEGVELLGPGGLLSQVTKAVLERALAEEMTGHLPAGLGSRLQCGKRHSRSVMLVPALCRGRGQRFESHPERLGARSLAGVWLRTVTS